MVLLRISSSRSAPSLRPCLALPLQYHLFFNPHLYPYTRPFLQPFYQRTCSHSAQENLELEGQGEKRYEAHTQTSSHPPNDAELRLSQISPFFAWRVHARDPERVALPSYVDIGPDSLLSSPTALKLSSGTINLNTHSPCHVRHVPEPNPPTTHARTHAHISHKPENEFCTMPRCWTVTRVESIPRS
jgi:hypothetical protein